MAFTGSSQTSSLPAIHGPRITGCTPGRPFLFRIPATGEGPLELSASGLPDGLRLDARTGIISGELRTSGEHSVTVTERDAHGETSRQVTIICGADKLARTPPMGWNSWNVWGLAVDEDKVRDAADWMVRSGLAAHGYQYITIDDGWEEGRDSNGEIVPNSKFRDMRALADYVHSLGLRIGIYSSPGPKTCGGYEGSYQHEEQDAQSYARWGVDYLKYDMCSYLELIDRSDVEAQKKPYRIMQRALSKCDRDIVYSISWPAQGWGREVGGNLWRTSDDTIDTWESMSGHGFAANGLEGLAGPGGWNDPDMLVVGRVGWGPESRPTRLSADEQITHISLWCLLAAPLNLGCDLSQMDEFTYGLLTNDEVLDVDQDPLGRQGWRVAGDDCTQIWMKPLVDGTRAVGLFNLRESEANITADWASLGLAGGQSVRDLWRREDLGVFSGEFSTSVPPHGAALLLIRGPQE